MARSGHCGPLFCDGVEDKEPGLAERVAERLKGSPLDLIWSILWFEAQMAETSGRKSDNQTKAAARQERLAEALRVNLRRRKGQKKARKSDGDETGTVEVKPDDGNNGPQGS